MRWGGLRRSGNIEDRRGMRMGGPVGVGGIGLVVLLVIGLITGVNPLELIGGAQGVQPVDQQVPTGLRSDDERSQFVAAVLGSTEDAWSEIFRQNGQTYPAPILVLFDGMTQSACGMGDAAVGPFYCPADQKVYLDLSFFRDLEARLGAPGDFAQAYVVAHEVGHHVQNVLGAPGMAPGRRSNALSVQTELQADCYAGVWGYHAANTQRALEPGDAEEALNAASAIGDDRLQKASQGVVVPESFTHGSSAQRVAWFRRGLESGDPSRCDTSR
jgi:predicted metalloprotease